MRSWATPLWMRLGGEGTRDDDEGGVNEEELEEGAEALEEEEEEEEEEAEEKEAPEEEELDGDDDDDFLFANDDVEVLVVGAVASTGRSRAIRSGIGRRGATCFSVSTIVWIDTVGIARVLAPAPHCRRTAVTASDATVPLSTRPSTMTVDSPGVPTISASMSARRLRA